MTTPRLADVDRDEALTEAIAGVCGMTRARLLRSVPLGGAAMLAVLRTGRADAAQGPTDLEILNFCLRFERLQATFYTQAEDIGTIDTMRAAKQRWAQTLGAHERAHVKIIKHVLGRRAEPRPTFDFGEANQTDRAFTRTAVAMEDLTVALLTGVCPQVHDRGLVAALMGLLTVEARHAAWARNIVGTTPAPAAFDSAHSLHQVRGVVARTGFVVRAPRTSARREPRYTG